MEHDIANVVLASTLLAGLAYLYLVEYRKYRDALTRDRLFALRDELFAYWRESGLSFDGLKAYGMLRLMINGAIRFAHRASLLHAMILHACLHKRISDDRARFFDNWTRALDELPEDARNKVEDIHRRYAETMVEQTAMSSIACAPLVVPFAFMLWLIRLWRKAIACTTHMLLPRVGTEMDYIVSSAAESEVEAKPA